MIKFIQFSVVVVFIVSCSATAPGDEDVDCVKNKHYSVNTKVLMDSMTYEQLLPGHSTQPIAGAAWTDASCDSNDNIQNPFSTPPYWQHGTGGLCAYQVQVCGHVVDTGPQNNWLFTQHISKALPPTATDSYSVRVFMNITYTFLSCRRRRNCKMEFLVHNYITNSERASLTCNQTKLFSGSSIKPSNVIVQTNPRRTFTDHRYFNLRTSQDGFYLALQDVGDNTLRGTCVAISKLIIYRHECHAQAVGQVQYPATQAPVSGTVTVPTQCVPNAHRSSSSLTVSCGSDGYWGSEHPECQCNEGYRRIIDRSGNQFCVACPAGTYRSASDPQGSCLQCPANTVTNKVAAEQCECLPGYFRNTEGLNNSCPDNQIFENPSYACTQPPSVPPYCGVNSVTATTIHLSWSPPQHHGSRSDLYYTVQYSDPDNVGQNIMVNDTICMNQTSFTITGLQPFTTYVVIVTAHNGVSDQDEERVLARMVQKRVTTNISLPGLPVKVTIRHVWLIIWEKPAYPNGIVEYYEIMFVNSTSNEFKTIKVVGNFYILSANDMKYNSVKIRAVNHAGKSDFTIKTPVNIKVIPNKGGTPTPDIEDNDQPTTPDIQTVATTQPPTETPPPPTLPTTTTSPPVVTITQPGAVSVSNITVLGCGIVAWKPPADTGGEMPSYAIRFFDRQSYETSQYREIQRHFGDTNRRWAVAANLPSDRTIFVDIRAKNSAGVGPFSEKKVVADSTKCRQGTESPTCATCPPATTCPPPPACPTTAAPTVCPMTTCPSCLPPIKCATCPPPPTCPTTAVPTECPVVTCPTCPPPFSCPTCQPPPVCSTPDTPVGCPTCPVPSPVTRPGAVSVSNITVLGCGTVVWKPPADTGGEMPGYAIRFFDGETYSTSRYREIQRYFDDPNRKWAVAANLPSSRTVYVDIRARNSGGSSSFSQKKVAANADLCSQRADPPTTPPPPPTCPTTAAPTQCPTVTCPSCPPLIACPTCQPPPVCPTTATVAPPTEIPPSMITAPSVIRNVRAVNCTTVEWDPPLAGGEITEYRIRVYSGASFNSLNRAQSRVLISYTNRLVLTWFPIGRPIKTIVKAKNSKGFSPAWTPVITLPECP